MALAHCVRKNRASGTNRPKWNVSIDSRGTPLPGSYNYREVETMEHLSGRLLGRNTHLCERSGCVAMWCARVHSKAHESSSSDRLRIAFYSAFARYVECSPGLHGCETIVTLDTVSQRAGLLSSENLVHRPSAFTTTTCPF